MTGTKVQWWPDPDIFDDIEFDAKLVNTIINELAYLNPGLFIQFIDNRNDNAKTVNYKYDNGVLDWVKNLTTKRKVLVEPVLFVSDDPKTPFEIAIAYTDEYTTKILSYVNAISTPDGGTHLTGFKTGLTSAINRWYTQNKPKKGCPDSLSGRDLEQGLVAVISVKVMEPQFEGQTKQKLGNSEVRTAVQTKIYPMIQTWLEETPAAAKQIMNSGITAFQAREAAQRAMDTVRRKGILGSGTILPGKLADCSSKNPELSEIYIVEGDSAGGSAKQGRDRCFQAILPLRGKILNVEKARLDQALANEQITTILTALGCGVGDSFDIKKLRYHKVIIMTDADVDGAHIRTLLLTAFWRLTPELVHGGYIYSAQPPLYKLKKGRVLRYALTEDERARIINEFGGTTGVQINRYKGLGEMNPEQLWTTTMDPERRTLLQIIVDDVELVDDIFDTLMGRNVESRREFIEQHANQVKNLDI
jgi:DNA gyrase subunit B